MKAKTINALLSKKFDNFLESITDSEVKGILRDNSIITGGSIVSMLLNANVNDFDIYLRSRAAAEAVAQYYVRKFKENPPPSFRDSSGKCIVEISVVNAERVKIMIKSTGVAGNPDSETAEAEAVENTTQLDDEPAQKLDDEKGEKYRPIFLTSNAITLSHKVQIVIRFYGEPEDIHRNYDFVHCTNYWTSWDKKLTLRQEALESILAKELRYMGSLYPICSVIRTRKFLANGWTINAGQLLKMCWQINQLDLKNIKVLEDQLVGVDAAYFGHLIDALSKVDLTTVDANYVVSVIDQIF